MALLGTSISNSFSLYVEDEEEEEEESESGKKSRRKGTDREARGSKRGSET
jgi:hypothetical protein